MAVQTITPQQLNELRTKHPVELIDVRSPSEYETMHVDGVRLIPLDKLDAKAYLAERGEGDCCPIYVICHSGMRANKACEQFIAAGFTNVINVEGGTMGWKNAGLPLICGKKTLSVERQTRITIGMGVLLGVLLGWLVHPAWLILAGFMGCGLIMAGVTDKCPLASGIAMMPWNQGNGSCCCGTAKT